MTTYPGLSGPEISNFPSREDSRDRYEPGTSSTLAGSIWSDRQNRHLPGDALSSIPRRIRPRRSAVGARSRLPGLCVSAPEQEIGIVEYPTGLELLGDLAGGSESPYSGKWQALI